MCTVYYFYCKASYFINTTGSFAVITLMSGKVVRMYAVIQQQPLTLNSTILSAAAAENAPNYTAVEVASAICFLVGIFQVSTVMQLFIL